ncbi:MAG: phosphoribosylglycinamide formyltransferase [Phycisphaeraceae bacterium]|nr:phosphoribosylglycinamide formyltransferase [Phycisphaeraceae bacterium]
MRPRTRSLFSRGVPSPRFPARASPKQVESRAFPPREARGAHHIGGESSGAPPARRGDVVRLAVCISGSGRTLANLHQVIQAGDIDASIVLVIASRECPGAERARALGLETLILPGEIPKTRLQTLLRDHRVDLVVLAGYLRRLPIPEGFRGRIVNIHPALLPRFGGPGMYGHHVHEAVLRAGEHVSGCTVHLCDEEYDQGEILLQRTCPVLPGDDAQTLGSRVFSLECEAYPEALRMLVARLNSAE